MKLKFLTFYGVRYLAPDGFEFLRCSIAEYPSFCGAGDGIGDKIVPEQIGGMRISHICHIHDESWVACDASYRGFTKSNITFAYNLAVYLSSGRGGILKTAWRLIKGCAYVVAVSTVGWTIFKKEKGVI